MSEQMKTWLNQFEKALKKVFYEDEVHDILSYYEEIIEERLHNGEDLEDILSDYDIQQIIKEMMPEVLMKRKNDSYFKMSRSTKQLLILLVSTPILLPLAAVFIGLLIFLGSMLLVSGFLILGAIGSYITLIIDLIALPQPLPNMIGLIGFGLMMTSLLILGSIWIYQLTMLVLRKIVVWFSKLAKKRG